MFLVLGMEHGAEFAVRLGWTLGARPKLESITPSESGVDIVIESAAARFDVAVTFPGEELPMVRVRQEITPWHDLLIPYAPRDFYPLGEHRDPTQAKGSVLAAQRALNSGIVFIRQDEPATMALYYQHFTALNEFFRTTETTPESVVGGNWPVLGYQIPSAVTKPLPAEKKMVISDALLVFSPGAPTDPADIAQVFLDCVAEVYRHIDHPPIRFNPWPEIAGHTYEDLRTSGKATETHFGDRYVRPYTNAEYPDAMVQCAVSLGLKEYGDWLGQDLPLFDELLAGVARFYDPKLKTLRRYLSDVGSDKDADQVDAWYLYHPLMTLGRMALRGNALAREHFFKSLAYGIETAHHFNYDWPVLFDVITRDVILEKRKEGEPGQSDVGGIYAYVMLQAYQLSPDPRYLEEARRAVECVREMSFEMLYQANLSAWGAVATVQLSRILKDERMEKLGLTFIANLFHNIVMWESDIALAENYCVFLGATCLHDARYMAMYECYETFAAFSQYLQESEDDWAPSVRLLMGEYYRYVLSRAIAYYPPAMPEEILAKENRNGHIDRTLWFPLEDIYASGAPSGAVGQEIYGCAAAFTYTLCAFQPLKAGGTLFCDLPSRRCQDRGETIEMELCASAESRGVVRLDGLPRNWCPELDVPGQDGPGFCRQEDGSWTAAIRGNDRFTIQLVPASP